jgi:hypothetical protein
VDATGNAETPLFLFNTPPEQSRKRFSSTETPTGIRVS